MLFLFVLRAWAIGRLQGQKSVQTTHFLPHLSGVTRGQAKQAGFQNQPPAALGVTPLGSAITEAIQHRLERRHIRFQVQRLALLAASALA